MADASLPRVVAVVAPHPDDETLGAGGFLNRLRRTGHDAHWIIVTEMSRNESYGEQRVAAREAEIAAVARHYGFASTRRLGYAPAGLSPADTPSLVADIGRSLDDIRPQAVLAPFAGDAHSDHAVVFGAVNAAVKSFRRPFITSFMIYETLSETGYNLDPNVGVFRPNHYVRLNQDDLDAKTAAMELFEGEVAAFPFPRSVEAIRALAHLRGSECCAEAAEGFMLLKMVV